MDGGIPPIDPLDLEMNARARVGDYTRDPERSGWLQRRMGANLLVLGLLLVAGLIVFLLTR
jgi:hypothetical protein